MKTLLSIAFLFITLNTLAQKEHFRIVDAATQKPIYGVMIKSFSSHDVVTFSNDSGYFNINVKATDTISISKDYYHTMYVTIDIKNFDSLHVITLFLAPSKQKTNAVLSGNLGGLQYFEYQFAHNDPAQNSTIGLKVYEPSEAIDVRMELASGHDDFRIGNINVDHMNIHPIHPKQQDTPYGYQEQEHSAPRK